MACPNFRDWICVKFIFFVGSCFLWVFRVIILPILPCQLIRKVWSIIAGIVSCCFRTVKCVVVTTVSFFFDIWARYIACPTIDAIKYFITGIIYWGYEAVKSCVVYVMTLLFQDLYKLAVLVITRDKEMGISKVVYEYISGRAMDLKNKVLQYFSGKDVKKFMTQFISASLMGVKDFVSQSVFGSLSDVKNNVSDYISDKVSSVRNYIPFLNNKSDSDKKSSDEDGADAEVVEDVTKVSAGRKLLNALPDNVQKSVERCKSTVKEAIEAPGSVQNKVKSSLKQKLSHNSPTKKTL